jgi:1L-myo-inositol 1-phosphate cytidylyltransferase / CDP-L-myo-inositol myo-inositolphosphotransferase
MTIPAVILFPDAPAAHLSVGGLSLGTRHIKELHKCGVRVFYLYGVTAIPTAVQRSRLPDDVVLHVVPPDGDHLPQHLQRLLHSADDVLLVRGDCLIDPRLLAKLLTCTQPQWLQAPDAPIQALPAAARLSPAQRDTWATAGLTQWLQHSPQLRREALDDYSPAHRGPVPFYVHVITTAADARAATQTLIRAAQKCALDLPALLLDPVFENRLVFWLCDTRITPNQVTLLTTLLGALIAALFLYGWLRLGIVLAYAVEVLDGVDGKLARTKLQTSRLGEFEHILDFFVEHAWYVTITIFLVTSTHAPQLWWVGGGLMASDLIDNLLYYLGQVLCGKQLDELGGFDRRFRVIAGRRNIYAWMFFFGFWAGLPVQIFVVTLVWSLITIGVHGVRLVYHARQRLAMV